LGGMTSQALSNVSHPATMAITAMENKWRLQRSQ
jgi:hypothetical protein